MSPWPVTKAVGSRALRSRNCRWSSRPLVPAAPRFQAESRRRRARPGRQRRFRTPCLRRRAARRWRPRTSSSSTTNTVRAASGVFHQWQSEVEARAGSAAAPIRQVAMRIEWSCRQSISATASMAWPIRLRPTCRVRTKSLWTIGRPASGWKFRAMPRRHAGGGGGGGRRHLASARSRPNRRERPVDLASAGCGHPLAHDAGPQWNGSTASAAGSPIRSRTRR